MKEPEPMTIIEMRTEMPEYEVDKYDWIRNLGKRFLNVIRNTVLLFISIPLISLTVIFIYTDWLLGGNSHNKIKNYIDDFVDEKINYVVEGVQENEQFIVLTPPEIEGEEEF